VIDLVRVLVFVLLPLLLAHGASAQCEVMPLRARDASANHAFASSLSVSGDWIVVGATGDDDMCGLPSNCDAGAAYVFRFNGVVWSQVQKLTPSQPNAGDRIGTSVDIDGQVLVLGASYDEEYGEEAGAAHVYGNATGQWVQKQRLTASDAEAFDRFGQSVAIDGETIVIGAPEIESGALTGLGSAYVFEFDGSRWQEVARLFASDGEFGDGAGFDVAIDGDVIVMGAFGSDESDSVPDSGAVYVFRRVDGTWSEEQKLTAPVLAPNSLFGYSVAVDGVMIVAGAWGLTRAYVYRYDGGQWNFDGGLSPHPVVARFGYSASITRKTIVVGAQDTGSGFPPTYGPGAAFLFQRVEGNWQRIARLTSSDLGEDDLFGKSVAIDQDRLVVGAPRNDALCPAGENCNTGSAYVFSVRGDCAVSGDCNEDGIVGLGDYQVLLFCLSGIPTDCACVDLNRNGLIDLGDYQLFQLSFSQFGTSVSGLRPGWQ
jgi:hypothetical protein